MTEGARVLLIEAYKAHSVIYVSNNLRVRANGQGFLKMRLEELIGLGLAEYHGAHARLTIEGQEEAEREAAIQELKDEPFPAGRFTPESFPGLFEKPNKTT